MTSASQAVDMQIGCAYESLTCTKLRSCPAVRSLSLCSPLPIRTGLVGRQMPLSNARKAAIVLIRNDIRLTDHEPLLTACSNKPSYLVPLYCLNPALLHPRSDCPSLGGIPVVGPHRCRWECLRDTCHLSTHANFGVLLHSPQTTDLQRRFLLEALQSLQQSLLALESNLHFASNTPDQELPALVHRLASQQISHIDLYHYLQIGRQCVEEEDAAAHAFTKACGQLGVASQIHQFWGHTMYHPQDAMAAISAPIGKGRLPAAQPSLIHHGVATFNRDQHLFRDVPHVMTSFRKVSCLPPYSHAIIF